MSEPSQSECESLRTILPLGSTTTSGTDHFVEDLTDHRYDLIEESPASTVSRTWTATAGGREQWIVLKTATVRRKFSKEPHDIIKELRILSSLSHPNVIDTLGHFHDTDLSSLNFWMPYVPLALSDLLASPFFSPHALPSLAPTDEQTPSHLEAGFIILAKSIMVQTLSAVAYLHKHAEGIAHRDLKPKNILITSNGCVKLIDFGIAWEGSNDQIQKQDDLWPEYPGKMYFEVSTSPYRAPELLFGTRSYNAFAIDIWSLGCIFAEFFTALRLRRNEDDNHDHEEDSSSISESDNGLNPFIIPKTVQIGDPETQWFRDTLFNAERGEIGLAWSIFKVRGTPTDDTWPTFKNLPDASRVIFNNVPAVPLSSLLPNLPTSSIPLKSVPTVAHLLSEVMSSSPLDLLHRFLVYSPSERLQAADALRHPWFTSEYPIPLPVGYPLDGIEYLREHVVFDWKGKHLGELLQVALPNVEA